MEKFAEGVEKRMKIVEEAVCCEAWKASVNPAEATDEKAIELEGYGPDAEEMEGFPLAGLQRLAARGVKFSVHMEELPPPPETEAAPDEEEPKAPVEELDVAARLDALDASERMDL
jgi:hypothetical protein